MAIPLYSFGYYETSISKFVTNDFTIVLRYYLPALFPDAAWFMLERVPSEGCENSGEKRRRYRSEADLEASRVQHTGSESV